MAEPENTPAEGGAPERDEPHVLAEWREKLERLRADGVQPFPHEFDGRVEIVSVHDAHVVSIGHGVARAGRRRVGLPPPVADGPDEGIVPG